MNHKQHIPGFLDRLMRIIDEESPHTWAGRIGIAKATMHGLLRDATPSSATLLKIAQRTNVSITWLLTGQGPERLVMISAQETCEPEREEQFFAPEWPEEPSVGPSAEWTRLVSGKDPAQLEWIMVRGDGMEPSLRAGDWLLVDRRERRIVSDTIHLLDFEGEWLPKRLQIGLHGEVRVGCDNPAYESFTLSRADRNRLSIIGRVIWIGRSI
ncbi:MAG: helix-turn-helix transcriptional regulator [Magnetococcales bacterium]|nr:helix-turn-helix transcriptional regulator [Magnetococcales bacterium]